MCYNLWYNAPTMLPAGKLDAVENHIQVTGRQRRVCGGTPRTGSCWSATSWVHYTTSCNTQSSAPEDGRNYCPKHVELIGIINKPLLLHLVGCLYYLYQLCTAK